MDLLNVVVPGVVSLIVIGGGYLANRKLGIASGQQVLVTTLKGEVQVYEAKVNRLEAEFVGCKARLEDLEAVVENLKAENFELRTDLTKRLLTTRRRRKPENPDV